MTYQNIILEHAEGGAVGVLTVNRPKALNALNAATLAELTHAVARDFSGKVTHKTHDRCT